MRFSIETLVLSTLAAGSASAASIAHSHGHLHQAKHVSVEKREPIVSRNLNLLSSVGASLLTKVGVAAAGLNPTGPGSTAWIGPGGQWTNTFWNQAADDMILTLWTGPQSWVNKFTPQITVSIPANQTQVISFANGWSGAWSGIWPDTVLNDGQIFETWGEATFVPIYGTVDVSRLPNMAGRNMSIVGPECTSDMNKCSFICGAGVNRCMTGYTLQSCTTSNQAGANNGADPTTGAASGGCSGMGNGANLKTYMGWTH